MKFKKGICMLVFAFVMMFVSGGHYYANEVQAVASTEIVAEGKCGTNLTWTLDAEGTLTIDGYGEMYYYGANWDDYTDNIKKVVFDPDMTSIAGYAFFGCSNLTGELKLPASLTTVGEAAFYSCKGLTGTLEIPSGLKTIGTWSFAYCTGLSGDVALPSSVEYIGQYSFYNSRGFDKLIFFNPDCEIYDDSNTIPSHITIEGYENSTAQAYAEKYQRGFRIYGSNDPDPWKEKLARQEKIWEMIDGYADPNYHLNVDTAKSKNSLTDEQYVELQTKAKEVIAGCTTQYEKIVAIVEYISDTIYYDYVYYDGYSKEVYINAYDVYVQKRTVCDGYARLTEVMMESVGIPCEYLLGYNHAYNMAYDADDDRWVFVDCTWSSANVYRYNVEKQENEWVDGGVYWTNFDLKPREIATLTNHETYELDGLLEPSGKLYYSLDCTGNTSEWEMKVDCLVNPNATLGKVIVEQIEEIPITKIGWRLFYGNETLKELDLTKTQVESIENGAFEGCTSLTKVSFPKTTLESIGSYAFYGCTSLTDVDLSGTNLETIDSYAFYDCILLKSVDLSATNLEDIGYYAFNNCTSLTKITLPQGALKEIEGAAFAGCTMLKEVDLSKTLLTTLEYSSFSNCTSLEKVNLSGTNLETIGYGAFSNCTSLREITLPKGTLKEIGSSAFLDCVMLKEIELSQTLLTTIEDNVFNGCKSLTSIELLDTKIESIRAYAFMNCEALETIKLPSTLKTIEYAVFYGCTGLKQVQIESEEIATQLISADSVGYLGKYAQRILIPSRFSSATDFLKEHYAIVEKTTLNGESYDVYNKHKHQYSSKVIQYGCKVEGIVRYTCAGCGDFYEEYSEPLDHNYEYYLTKEASCTEEGHDVYKCFNANCKDGVYTTCDSEYATDVVSPLGHKFTNYVSCGTGLEMAVCDRFGCSEVDYKTVSVPVQKGWVNSGGKWYYRNSNGDFVKGWLYDSGAWYYLKSDGVMATGWVNDGGTWYYMKSSGAMATGWLYDGGTWYYLKSSGAMATGWLYDGGTWYYMKSSGAMATGWVNDGGTWYYMKSSGAMVKGWVNDGGTWYYMKSSGAMATGWIQDGGKWYYLKPSGAMATNTWIGTYYVNASGAWVK